MENSPRRSVQKRLYEIENVCSVEPEHSARAAARAVQGERGDACDDVAGAEEIRAAGIAEAGAARAVIVREEQREVAGEARVDLNQVRLREHADALHGRKSRIDLLNAVPNGGE